ncbi:aspartyl/glutamyl-tRNA amidotransferase subunit B [Spiroplasma sp. TIUS-1]|uniref:Asp-tRNA(Asn)/Glu-tRNA(Gln) amidotransferase subunit GatB n=1 Tax=Spiroplasma sp. TIUS-1 TaxID=216963 RepID=UPI001396EFFD|nr:Asp-tRNA(Asn)/Glu-tRNA(Gln) amidotransferase subunit GatB [Spiroplasma sp. TIUS-1]QHX36138.1 aspartyl/glutamyl-tRNA amidotransferase subunit B [Spiroplasma sp. TIUS-1]
MNNFEVVIGIENHVELKTMSKMFASSQVNFNSIQNTNIDAMALALPGALPTVNKKGVELAILACNGLNMKIDSLLRFDRKSYFYSDLPKGFQITQNFYPIGKDGFLEINVNGKTKRVQIERLHIEEDTAKQTHKGDLTYIDYNRSGDGLVEIVTKPVLRSADEVIAYLEELRETLLFLGISDVKMNEGSLRCDVNISLRPYGYKEFGTKVEIKNLNSFNNVRKAIEFEIKKQTSMLLKNEPILSETKRFDEASQETKVMRLKDTSVDYKYFEEPNITPIRLEEEFINQVIENAPELAKEKRKKYVFSYKLSEKDANQILSNYELTMFFEELIKLNIDPKKAYNLITSDIQASLNTHNIEIKESNFTPSKIADVMNRLDRGKISSKHVKAIVTILGDHNKSISSIIEENNLKVISDPKFIEDIIVRLAKDNQEMIQENIHTRPERVEKTLMGQLMKETGGNVSLVVANEILLKLLKSFK